MTNAADFIVISVPIVILWHVRISLYKKLALAGLFCLVIFTTLFALLRVSLVGSPAHRFDSSWFFMWSCVLQNIGQLLRVSKPRSAANTIVLAIIVACLDSFQTLFTRSQRQQSRPACEASRNIRYRRMPRHPLEQSITMDNVVSPRNNSTRDEPYSSERQSEPTFERNVYRSAELR